MFKTTIFGVCCLFAVTIGFSEEPVKNQAVAVSTTSQQPLKQTQPAAHQDAEEAAQGAYNIKKGDTLWSIANETYSDPYLWQKLWEVNKDTIQDPNLIFPEQAIKTPAKEELGKITVSTNKIYRPGKAEKAVVSKENEPEDTAVSDDSTEEIQEAQVADKSVEADKKAPDVAAENVETGREPAGEQLPKEEVKPEPSLQPEAAEVSKPEKSKIEAVVEAEYTEPEEEIDEKPAKGFKKESKAPFMGDNFIVKKNFEFDGEIIEFKDKKQLISQMDSIILNIGSSQGLKKGMYCYLFRRTEPVRDTLGKFIGYKVKKIGKIKITSEISDKTSVGMIVMCHEPVIIGDYVRIIK